MINMTEAMSGKNSRVWEKTALSFFLYPAVNLTQK